MRARLVLLHPIGLDRRCWHWARLDGAIAVDLPGHGDEPLGDATELSQLADRLVGSLDGPLDLVGVSFGGAVAQHVAVRHPRRVRSAVFACCSAATRREILDARAEALLREGLEAAVPPMLERWFSPQALAAPHPAVAYARRRLLADDAIDLAACWRLLARHDLRSVLPSLRLPVTVLGAKGDTGTPVSAVDELHRLVVGSVLAFLPGPHMIHMEEGPAFAAAVRRHLQRVEVA